ncbi:phage holin family protein [Hymenobacter sp. ASUV-10]|uniref:Phage holin family protein n=1 Tax=Hymenobacter aranciens TaxID=3063996 RepID=A0ABT9BB97_9BACT|nr:phage holin family protein [Hymenobacter sp. ASUV-10]MDO7875542.1 phage holin family protein [Hymenobacter sp. ASUV-10]
MRLLLTLLTTSKWFQSLALGVVLTPVLAIVQKYIFADWEFLRYLGVLLVVDTILGVRRHWLAHTISSRGFSRLFQKSGIYLALLVLTHVLSSFTVHGEPNLFFKWFDTFMYSCMMAREALSILEHAALIEPRLVPKALLKRLALVSEEGFEAALTAMPASQLSTAPLSTAPPAPPIPSPTDASPLTDSRYDA